MKLFQFHNGLLRHFFVNVAVAVEGTGVLDVQSLLTIYEGIFTKSGLEKLTGINQKQLWHYAKGASKPRPEQRRKIERALHRLGSELVSLSL